MNHRFLVAAPFVGSVLMAASIYALSPKVIMSSANHASELVPRVEKAIEALSQGKSSSETNRGAEQRSTRFWASVTKAYEWLKEQGATDRYFFLFSVVESSGIAIAKDREEALRMWLEVEGDRFTEGQFSYAQHGQWKKLMGNISANLNEMLSQKQVTTNTTSNSEIVAMLKSLRADIETLGNTKVPVTQNNNLELIVLIGAMGSMLSYLAGRNKKNTPEVKTAQIQEVTSPLEKVRVFDLVSNTEKGSTVDLEEVCKQGVDNLQYLFNTSGLRIYSRPQSPTLNRLCVQKDRVANAVDSLIRGAVVLAQNETQNNLSMQWSCTTTEDRATIDLDIVGKEFTLDELRRNHEILEGGSVVSQFARAEKQLETYRPAIKIVPAEGKTRISLSLEVKSAHPAVLQVQ
jgi:hypothetical protein